MASLPDRPYAFGGVARQSRYGGTTAVLPNAKSNNAKVFWISPSVVQLRSEDEKRCIWSLILLTGCYYGARSGWFGLAAGTSTPHRLSKQGHYIDICCIHNFVRISPMANIAKKAPALRLKPLFTKAALPLFIMHRNTDDTPTDAGEGR
jgi:hypothetical protein